MALTADEIRAIIREELGCARMVDVPVSLRRASEICQVEYKWLLERVQRSEIPAYRPNSAASWRVYPRDVVAFLTTTTNQQPKKRLRRAA